MSLNTNCLMTINEINSLFPIIGEKIKSHINDFLIPQIQSYSPVRKILKNDITTRPGIIVYYSENYYLHIIIIPNRDNKYGDISFMYEVRVINMENILDNENNVLNNLNKGNNIDEIPVIVSSFSELKQFLE